MPREGGAGSGYLAHAHETTPQLGDLSAPITPGTTQVRSLVSLGPGSGGPGEISVPVRMARWGSMGSYGPSDMQPEGRGYVRKPAGPSTKDFGFERSRLEETPRWPASWHGFRVTLRKKGLLNRRRLLGGVYATQKEQEPCAAAAHSQPGCAGMAPGCLWNICSVTRFGPLASFLYGRRAILAEKLARIPALVCGYELLLFTYNKHALRVYHMQEMQRECTRCLGIAPLDRRFQVG